MIPVGVGVLTNQFLDNPKDAYASPLWYRDLIPLRQTAIPAPCAPCATSRATTPFCWLSGCCRHRIACDSCILRLLRLTRT
jgi:hypothetical protein